MFAEVMTAVLHGMEAIPVTVETTIDKGLPMFQIVGLADKSVNEAKERIRSALHFSGLEFPMGRITVNMAPAGIWKRGSHFDAAIALSILASSGQIEPNKLFGCCIIGELSLDGRVKQVGGALAIAASMEKYGIKKLFLPEDNLAQASLLNQIALFPASSLSQLVLHFSGMKKILPQKKAYVPVSEGLVCEKKDFRDVRGQETAKRAILVAAAGGHGIFMIGNPSAGKTMLAERIPSILPPMTEKEILRASIIWSAAGKLGLNQVISERPVRTPGTNSTAAALLGGGLHPMPGEISLADSGVLFLDEVCEFPGRVLDSLRAPLERKEIDFVRYGETYRFPARFFPVFASNPCKCGYYGDPNHVCTCTDGELAHYRAKISGAILDRMDITISLPPVTYDKWREKPGMGSEEMKKQLLAARARQEERFHMREYLNGDMSDEELDRYVPIDRETDRFLKNAYQIMGLDPRGIQKVRRIARTIADLEGSEEVRIGHFAEAVRYREDIFERSKRKEAGRLEI